MSVAVEKKKIEPAGDIRKELKLSRDSGDILLDALIELGIQIKKETKQNIDHLCLLETFIITQNKRNIAAGGRGRGACVHSV